MKGFVRILVVAISLTACFGFKCEAKTFYTPPEKSIEELYQDIFVSLLGVQIDKAVDAYYKDVLNEPPTVYPYQVYIEKVERIGEYRSFEFTVIMNVLPVVGPHVQVGLERLTFYISGSGEVKLTKYEHIKDYELPENWKHIIIHSKN